MAIKKKYLKEVVKGNKASLVFTILLTIGCIAYLVLFLSNRQLRDLIIFLVADFGLLMFILSYISEYKKVKEEGEKK